MIHALSFEGRVYGYRVTAVACRINLAQPITIKGHITYTASPVLVTFGGKGPLGEMTFGGNGLRGKRYTTLECNILFFKFI